MLLILLMVSEIGRDTISKNMANEYRAFIAQNTCDHYEIDEDVYAISNGKKSYSVHSTKEYAFDRDKNRFFLREEDKPISDSAPVADKISSRSKLMICNEMYKTGLLKKDNKSEWAMTLLQKDNPVDRLSYLKINNAKSMPWSCYMTGVGVGTLNNKQYEFTNYREEMDGNLLVVKATAKTNVEKPLFDSFVLWLNPNKGWRIERYEIHKSWGKQLEENGVAYGVKTFDDKNPLMMINEVIEYKNPKFEYSLFKEYRIRYRSDALDPKMFFLATYNVPEPNLVKSANYSLYYYVGLAILLSIGLLFVIKVLKKQ